MADDLAVEGDAKLEEGARPAAGVGEAQGDGVLRVVEDFDLAPCVSDFFEFGHEGMFNRGPCQAPGSSGEKGVQKPGFERGRYFDFGSGILKKLWGSCFEIGVKEKRVHLNLAI